MNRLFLALLQRSNPHALDQTVCLAQRLASLCDVVGTVLAEPFGWMRQLPDFAERIDQVPHAARVWRFNPDLPDIDCRPET
jgi:hypothetical protein